MSPPTTKYVADLDGLADLLACFLTPLLRSSLETRGAGMGCKLSFSPAPTRLSSITLALVCLALPCLDF